MSKKKFEVWTEGYRATGEHGNAFRLLRKGESDSKFEGIDFKDACYNALRELNWDMNLYDYENNSYWACKLYDNEQEARKHFG